MNFFNSVFDDSPQSESNDASHNIDQLHDPDHNSGAGAWNFGGLIQTLTTKSESIIETYRRDLHEFSTGLKKEIEVAQGSLGTVTHVIDEFGNTVVKGTAQIISKGKDAILAVDLDSDSHNSNNTPKHRLSNISDKSLNSKRYSRFDAQVRAIQVDASTYTEGPEDLDEYNKWKLEFSLDGKSEEIEGFLKENDAMENFHNRIVPNNVDNETFWYRYYYKVYRLKKAEDVRARLVRRMSREDEDLTWDVEDDDDDDDNVEEEEAEAKPELVTNMEIGSESKGKTVDTNLPIGSSGTSDEEGTKRLNAEKERNAGEEGSMVERKDDLVQNEELGNKMDETVEDSQVENSGVVNEVDGEKKETVDEAGVGKASKSEVENAMNINDSAATSDEKEITEEKTDDAKSTDKNNEPSKVGSQHSAHDDEEDFGWDEIEDLSSFDDKKATGSDSRSEVDLRKRLSAAEAEEDLSWDIEDDDDEPAKP
ncbi:PREDICTED: BSD domain-containing protein 1-like isoform X2 [Lupinus angustifolius]|uniref:BSD domain-containing protein 1-like isoform X2 n=1 Tax=Lupinus angustifolius TaxID=3871 RepID=UPI00092E779C|nr:PREDICTED: BSD domain-containing protein 1-like isoform X2 [Lupinus angustifolius]